MKKALIIAAMVAVLVIHLRPEAQVGLFEGRPVVEAPCYTIRTALVEFWDNENEVWIRVPYSSILYLYEDQQAWGGWIK